MTTHNCRVASGARIGRQCALHMPSFCDRTATLTRLQGALDALLHVGASRWQPVRLLAASVHCRPPAHRLLHCVPGRATSRFGAAVSKA